MEMDDPLEKIVTGSWDLQAAIADHKKAIEDRDKMMKFQAKLNQARNSKDSKTLVATIDEIVSELPRMEGPLGLMKFGAHAQDG